MVTIIPLITFVPGTSVSCQSLGKLSRAYVATILLHWELVIHHEFTPGMGTTKRNDYLLEHKRQTKCWHLVQNSIPESRVIIAAGSESQ